MRKGERVGCTLLQNLMSQHTAKPKECLNLQLGMVFVISAGMNMFRQEWIVTESSWLCSYLSILCFSHEKHPHLERNTSSWGKNLLSFCLEFLFEFCNHPRILHFNQKSDWCWNDQRSSMRFSHCKHFYCYTFAIELARTPL